MQYIASLSYGKDSIYMLEVIKQNNLPLDRIVHAEIMATPTIPADLPPMINFKKYADKIIKKRYGINVEHIKAPKSYEEYFYSVKKKGNEKGRIYGFPYRMGAWCNARLKMSVFNKFNKEHITQYIGIAFDEPKRFKGLNDRKISPLVDYKITEQQCYNWCKENDLLSPIYKHTKRGGCWFCHNQRLSELRHLRKAYPEYWDLMLKWDKDTLTSFKYKTIINNGEKKNIPITIHDLDRRFEAEDQQQTLMIEE